MGNKVNQCKYKHVGTTDTIIAGALERNINCTGKPKRIFKNVRKKFRPFDIALTPIQNTHDSTDGIVNT